MVSRTLLVLWQRRESTSKYAVCAVGVSAALLTALLKPNVAFLPLSK